MREIRPLHGRLPCKGGGLTGMAYTVGLRTAVYVLLPYIILFFKHKAGISHIKFCSYELANMSM